MKKLIESKKSTSKNTKTSIKGKQILVGGLVVLVAVAGYYRYITENSVPGENSEEMAVPVMTTVKTEVNYFDDARQERDSARSEAENLLEKITKDDEATADAKAKARENLENSAENIKKEGEIEGLVKSKGYEDCIAFIDENEIRIVVKGDKLDEDKVSAITEIATSKTDFKPSQIIVSCHK